MSRRLTTNADLLTTALVFTALAVAILALLGSTVIRIAEVVVLGAS
jgi:uncharacterized membrane protein